MRLLVSLWWALLFTLVSNIAAAEPCEDLIKMDGLLTQAKRVCPFSYYAFRFQLESKTCMEKKVKKHPKNYLRWGILLLTAKQKKWVKNYSVKNCWQIFQLQ